MSKPLTYGLSHIAIRVKDLNRTREFYQRVFDMEVMYNESDFIQLTTPGAHDILVFEKGTPNAVTGGIVHFGFRLKDASDIGKVVEKLKETGATILSTGEFVPGSPYVFFQDPDGYEVEVWYEKLG